MRTFLPAVLACLALASVIGGRQIAAAVGANPAKAPAPASPPSTAPRPAPASAAGSSIDNDAPARHARRTACLKDAKNKKLVGAQRDAYVKNCVGTI